MKRIATVLGTRSAAIRMSPVVQAAGCGVVYESYRGQGCSRDVDPSVLWGLGLPDARYNPDVGSGSGGCFRESRRSRFAEKHDAVFLQSLKAREVIVVGGHSTDRTVEPPKNIGRRVVFLGGRDTVGCAHNSVAQTFKCRSFKMGSGV